MRAINSLTLLDLRFVDAVITPSYKVKYTMKHSKLRPLLKIVIGDALADLGNDYAHIILCAHVDGITGWF